MKVVPSQGKNLQKRVYVIFGLGREFPQRGRRAPDCETETHAYAGITRPRKVEPPKCTCCGEGAHFLYNCYRFVHGFGVLKKKKFVEMEGRCFRCLRSGHMRATCLGREVECRFCKKADHHYLLCVREEEQGEVKVAHVEEGPTSANPDEFNFEALGEAVTNKRVTPMQMVLHVLDHEGRIVKINALPDTGSTHNVVELEALKRLGLKGTKCQYTVTGHGGHTSTHKAVCATIALCSPDWKNQYQAKFFAYENPCGGMQPEDWSCLKKGWKHLKKLDIPPPVQERPIEAILGCVNLSLFEAVRPPANGRKTRWPNGRLWAG